MKSPSLATKFVAHPQRLVAALLYILTFCVPVTLNLRTVDYRHFSQHSSSTDSCLSLLNYLHVGFLFRSRFLPFTAQLYTGGFLGPFQIPAFHCSTIDTWVSYSVPDFCLSLPNYLQVVSWSVPDFCLSLLNYLVFTNGFLIPFQIPTFHCSTIYTWVSYSVPDFYLSLLNYLHVGFFLRSRFLPFTAQLYTVPCPSKHRGLPLFQNSLSLPRYTRIYFLS